MLIPVLTRYLNPGDYGLVSIFQVISTLLISFVGLNTHNSVIIQYYKREELNFPNYVFNTLLILTISTTIILFIFFIFGHPISKLIDFPSDWLPAIVIFASSQFLFQLLLGLWIAEEKPFYYGIFQVSQTSLNLLLSMILVIPIELGWKGRILGQVIVFIIYGVITIFILWKKGFIASGYNKAYVRKAINFGVPLIPHTFGGSVLMLSDRLIISSIAGVSEVGIYMVGFQFAQIIMLLQDSFNSAFAPWIYKNLSKNTLKENIRLVKITYIYFVLILVFAIAYSLLIPPFYKIFVGSEFMSGERFILWVAIGFSFNGMYKMVVNYIFY